MVHSSQILLSDHSYKVIIFLSLNNLRTWQKTRVVKYVFLYLAILDPFQKIDSQQKADAAIANVVLQDYGTITSNENSLIIGECEASLAFK